MLSYQPEILVFDEPSTNMDPLNRRKLIEWLKQSDKTILLCTHDLDIALEVCDRCLVLSEGRFIKEGPASEILYDRELLEENKLELPLALMTHELLHDILHSAEMDEEHRSIIGKFLHSHRHAHGADGHVHYHIHAHPHEHGHRHEHNDTEHSHHGAHSHDEDHTHSHDDLVPHSDSTTDKKQHDA